MHNSSLMNGEGGKLIVFIVIPYLEIAKVMEKRINLFKWKVTNEAKQKFLWRIKMVRQKPFKFIDKNRFKPVSRPLYYFWYLSLYRMTLGQHKSDNNILLQRCPTLEKHSPQMWRLELHCRHNCWKYIVTTGRNFFLTI